MGDKSTPYSVLKKIMLTCSEAEYGKVSFAVVERETGGDLNGRVESCNRVPAGLVPYYRRYDLPWRRPRRPSGASASFCAISRSYSGSSR